MPTRRRSLQRRTPLQVSADRRAATLATALGRAVRCTDLSRFYQHGWGTPVDAVKEAAALARACKLGNKRSCK